MILVVCHCQSSVQEKCSFLDVFMLMRMTSSCNTTTVKTSVRFSLHAERMGLLVGGETAEAVSGTRRSVAVCRVVTLLHAQGTDRVNVYALRPSVHHCDAVGSRGVPETRAAHTEFHWNPSRLKPRAAALVTDRDRNPHSP